MSHYWKRRFVYGTDSGNMGQVHPLVAKNYGLDCEVYCAEIDFSNAFEMILPEPTFTPLPKYPLSPVTWLWSATRKLPWQLWSR